MVGGSAGAGAGARGGEKVGIAVRSVCHHGIINTKWGRSKKRKRRGLRAKGRNCKPRVPDTTCYYF